MARRATRRRVARPGGGAAIDNNFQWTESFSVGHEGLDAEHRTLIQAINDICEAIGAGRPSDLVGALFAALERTAAEHFAHENAVMQEILAGGERQLAGEVRAMTERAIAGHVAEHERTLEQLREIIGTAEARPGGAGAAVCAELKRWFVDHAVKYDSHLKAIFQAM